MASSESSRDRGSARVQGRVQAHDAGPGQGTLELRRRGQEAILGPTFDDDALRSHHVGVVVVVPGRAPSRPRGLRDRRPRGRGHRRGAALRSRSSPTRGGSRGEAPGRRSHARPAAARPSRSSADSSSGPPRSLPGSPSPRRGGTRNCSGLKSPIVRSKTLRPVGGQGPDLVRDAQDVGSGQTLRHARDSGPGIRTGLAGLTGQVPDALGRFRPCLRLCHTPRGRPRVPWLEEDGSGQYNPRNLASRREIRRPAREWSLGLRTGEIHAANARSGYARKRLVLARRPSRYPRPSATPEGARGSRRFRGPQGQRRASS